MDDLPDKQFADALTILEHLESAYTNAADGTERQRIKAAVQEIVNKFSDTNLASYQLYAEERLQRTQATLKSACKNLKEVEAEIERRRRKG